MNHLLNILAGVGQVINALGSAPQYRYPQVGDRRMDAKNIAGGFVTVGRDLKKKADKELTRHSHGKIDHSAASQ
ncbi:hypothetical protein [Ramlibacter sp. 2FC]|uniref:hypothetical protein n=1 Tax=Ramlibacter sp. 2FC TaxID=2502188 RepID=UPI0010F5CB85|nr:hypothetical protein [Ramlibacter sp. 2FC]